MLPWQGKARRGIHLSVKWRVRPDSPFFYAPATQILGAGRVIAVGRTDAGQYMWH
jgi:hypothetical protein